MLVASVVMHGLLIAVAAAWPTRPIPLAEQLENDPVGDILDPADTQASPPEAEPPPPPPEDPIPTPPPDEPSDAIVDSTPPPAEPTPVLRPPSPPRPAAVTPPSTRPRPAVGRPNGNPNALPTKPSVGTGGGTWSTPKPAYPFQARRMRLQGSGGVRVTTDATGRITSATMSPSIHPLLDATALAYARTAWKGPPNTTRVVPITFQLE